MLRLFVKPEKSKPRARENVLDYLTIERETIFRIFYGNESNRFVAIWTKLSFCLISFDRLSNYQSDWSESKLTEFFFLFLLLFDLLSFSRCKIITSNSTINFFTKKKKNDFRNPDWDRSQTSSNAWWMRINQDRRGERTEAEQAAIINLARFG